MNTPLDIPERDLDPPLEGPCNVTTSDTFQPDPEDELTSYWLSLQWEWPELKGVLCRSKVGQLGSQIDLDVPARQIEEAFWAKWRTSAKFQDYVRYRAVTWG